MNLDNEHFINIKIGLKQFELRVFDSKRQKIKLLDKIKFMNRQTKETFEVVVTELKWFQNFNEALLDSPLKFILPGLKTRKKALLLYESFPGYKENSEKYGVLKIGFKLK